ncbi:nucleotidyltransferase and HEPN domain-containing protein [Sphingomonas zeae]|uniref:HEPN domain-containing protein n=1 Tax=Sphingomonas zeae TaxID=1646122 RepID=A0A7Y6B391_9SPHN|nr:nucleotidyltransferase and HEPN domain-containing protein [Sphingomonas zeae]MBB4050234.1 putative nucleotidyltransferase/HEPN domain-containing protein [Sphingomonas zeae]NUU46616.1 HEPN domain-containing protein [Sphingomonas zeae]
MRDDVAHLPDKKRRDLDRIVEVLFAEFEQATSLSTQKWRRQGRILKVILYGSYARGDWVDDPIGGYQADYDILVVVSDERLTEPGEFWAKADDQFVCEVTISKRISAPVSFIVHSLADVNNQLTQGRPFFIDAIDQGIALYEVEDFPFVTPRPLEPKAARAEAQKHFDKWFPGALRRFDMARGAIEKGYTNEAAFDLHQTTEQLYHCFLLTLTLYSPKSHKLNFLRSQAEPLVHELIAVWPRDTKFAQRCFELLRQAYVNARYSPHYKVTPAELEWLAERVELLQQIVKEACEKRLAQA